MDLEGTVEKVQEISSVLVQARNLPGGPRRYYRKSAGKFTVLQARDLPGGPRRYYRKSAGKFTRPGTFLAAGRDLPGGPRRYEKSAGKFTCTGAGQGPSRWT